MSKLIPAIALFFLLSFSATAETPVNPDALPDPVQEAAARELMKEIRCLVCQNQSIEDSNADLAKDLRQVIREHIAAGKSPKEIKAWLVARYGDWILLEPPLDGRTLFLWGAPFVILGGIVIWLGLRTRAEKTALAPLSSSEQKELAALLGSDSEVESATQSKTNGSSHTASDQNKEGQR